MPTKKFVLRRKYKEYLDPTAQDWYNSIFDARVIKDWTTKWNLNPMTEKQERINAADDIERIYRTRAKRYIEGRLKRESDPNFVGPTIPISIKTLPSTIKKSIEIANRAEGDHPLDYDPNHTIMITRDAHWPEKGWQEGATVTYPEDTLHKINPTNNHPNFVHYKLGGNIRKKAAIGDNIRFGRLYNPDDYITSPNFTFRRNSPKYTLFNTSNSIINSNDNFWTRTGITPYDLGATGVQLIGNLASSLINQAAINRLKFTPIHTPTAAEAPVKFNTTYNINPQLDNLRESIDAVEREATNNSASSRNTLSRILGSRLRGVGVYNDLYGQKLNQETNMMNIDAQNRQGAYARNTNRLQQNLARDTMYNTQGQDNLDNTKSMYTGRNWSNFTEQATGSFIGAYNRGQHRLKDINDLSYFYAANPNSAPILMNRNSPRFRNILNNLYDSFGFKLGGKSSLIRK